MPPQCPRTASSGIGCHSLRVRACCRNGTQGCALCGHRTFCPVYWIQRSRTPLAAQTASLCSSFWATRPLDLGNLRNPRLISPVTKDFHRAWALLFARLVLGLIFFMAGVWKVIQLRPLEHARNCLFSGPRETMTAFPWIIFWHARERNHLIRSGNSQIKTSLPGLFCLGKLKLGTAWIFQNHAIL
jgi:hypothetical protein